MCVLVGFVSFRACVAVKSLHVIQRERSDQRIPQILLSVSRSARESPGWFLHGNDYVSLPCVKGGGSRRLPEGLTRNNIAHYAIPVIIRATPQALRASSPYTGEPTDNVPLRPASSQSPLSSLAPPSRPKSRRYAAVGLETRLRAQFSAAIRYAGFAAETGEVDSTAFGL